MATPLTDEVTRLLRAWTATIYFAFIDNEMGDGSKTFEWSWKAIGEHSDYLMYLRVEPQANKLATNPEFLRVMVALHR
jgi:hypothetical protein